MVVLHASPGASKQSLQQLQGVSPEFAIASLPACAVGDRGIEDRLAANVDDTHIRGWGLLKVPVPDSTVGLKHLYLIQNRYPNFESIHLLKTVYTTFLQSHICIHLHIP
ncbi:hypothetical protein RSAG8_06614, partial [Rhizoctonia solani AG-8 WAC10335]